MSSTIQIYPPISSSTFLVGDVITSGNVAKVVGIQTIPVDSTPPTDKQVLEFNATTGDWTPTSLTPLAAGDILVNSAVVSTDSLILVDAAFAIAPNALHVLVNGA